VVYSAYNKEIVTSILKKRTMKYFVIIAMIFLCFGCFKNKPKETDCINPLLDENSLNSWEIATSDTINHFISKLYEKAGHENIYLKNVMPKLQQLYDHGGRRILAASLKSDSIFLRYKKIKELILIENIDNENRSKFDIIMVADKNPELLSYYKKHQFVLRKKVLVDLNKFNSFLTLLEKSNILDTLRYGSEFEFVVTRFVNNKILVYPFLCGNFEGDLNKLYFEMLLTEKQ
jgi:hypothetical protein